MSLNEILTERMIIENGVEYMIKNVNKVENDSGGGTITIELEIIEKSKVPLADIMSTLLRKKCECEQELKDLQIKLDDIQRNWKFYISTRGQ